MTLPISGTPVNIDFDPSEIAVGYAQARQARVRPDGLAQFEGLDDKLEYLDTDMYTVWVDRPVGSSMRPTVAASSSIGN
jgi:cyclohexanone monooxygenase